MEEIKTPKDIHIDDDIPELPIKTYQWEDIRRARKKGGYPWTHLTKPPFDEEVDPGMFTMDAYKRSKSSSSFEHCDLQEIPEVTDIECAIEESLQEDVEETKNESRIKNKSPTPETIENDESYIDDKELPTRVNDNKENLLGLSNSQNIRACSEEPKKTRRLSVESSHSRISLSKLAIKSKIKNAKEKLKIPKLLKRSKSDAQENRKPKIQKTEGRKLNNYKGQSEPVYIHIPLKPPPGETDEYSKYEFESPGPSSHSASLTNLKHFGSGKRKMSLLGLLTELKRIYDEQVSASESAHELSGNKLAPKTTFIDTSSTRSLPEQTKIEDVTDDIINNKHDKKLKKSAQELKEMLASSDAYSVGSNLSQYLDKDDHYEIIATEVPDLDIDCVIITDYDKPPADTPDHSNLNEFPEWTRLNPNENTRLQVRAKSEEPKRKRKSSIDSSYSRKSLSKLAFMKKLKSAKDSIKLPRFLSFTKPDDKGLNSKTKSEEKEVNAPKQVEPKKINPKKSETPLYIHIPLKLPEGQTDEFSHLADEDCQNKADDGKPVDESGECETPISPVAPSNDVHLIFLTPPSDDEILDASVPETPSETDQKFFETLKVDELKCIAKKAVDIIYPDKKKLEVVTEDDKSEEEVQPGVETEGGTMYWQMHPVLVDVEDGLKLSDAAIALINEEMSKELDVDLNDTSPEIPPQIKKKVSFKKSRAQDGERIYEDVGLPSLASADGKAPLEQSRSMSADEEKSYLDEKVIKTTSLDEDYNKWSKITDHEYEPVNPPPENMNVTNAVDSEANLATNSTHEQPNNILNETLPYDISENLKQKLSAQSFQNEIEDCFFNTSNVTVPNIEDNTKYLKPAEQQQSNKSTNKRKNKPAQKRSTGKNLNEAIKTQAGIIKTKLQNIKKPHINLPHPPKLTSETFSKLKFKKPNFSVPKMPEMPSINLASLNLTRKNSSKNDWRKRQYSTESNVGDSKTKRFDFSTYPRIFEKSKIFKQKSLDDSVDNSAPSPVFATVPRTARARSLQERKPEPEKDDQPKEYYYDKARGFITIPIDFDNDNALYTPSHIRYDQDIDIDDGFNGEPEDSEIPQTTQTPIELNEKDIIQSYNKSDMNGDIEELQSNQSSGSISEHRQGVIEEIDSDQFFLREKGISQDDIDVGNYLSSEIKEAFRNPINALTQFQSEDREYDVDVTDQSESSEELPKRKWLKKPKRKKTPHVSNEQLSFEFGSDPEDYVAQSKIQSIVTIPMRPKRRSKKGRKKKIQTEDVIPYQETIPFEEPFIEQFDFMDDQDEQSFEPTEPVESLNMYNNELNIKKYELKITDNMYVNTPNETVNVIPMYINTTPISEVQPIRPVRKNKSIKSLNAIEVDLDNDRNVSVDKSINSFEESGTFEVPDSSSTPPIRPVRNRSHTRSESVTSLRERDQKCSSTLPTKPLRFRSRTRSQSTPSIPDTENVTSNTAPIRPNRLRARTRTPSVESFQRSENIDILPDNTVEIICVEEPCIQIVCDCMGYAVVDKTKMRDPPLPPTRYPQTPPRKRRSKPPVKDKFATVPRPPDRPIRNYSTLQKHIPTSTSSGNMVDDDKENVDVNPYIEIDEDEHPRRLQSGEVIQKMRARPLPAPPRPPRKAKTPSREVLKDISHEQNVSLNNNNTLNSTSLDKTDFLDKISDVQLLELEQQILTDDHEETITHAALVVQPIGESSVISHSELFNSSRNSSTFPATERIVLIEQEITSANSDGLITEQFIPTGNIIEAHITTDETVVEPPQIIQEDIDSDEEISEVPEEFHKFKLPEPESLNTEDKNNIKLQQLDVEKLRVNELTANKIVVTDLEGISMNVAEVNSKAGNLLISGIELPPNIIQEMLDRFQPHSQYDQSDTNKHSSEENILVEQIETDDLGVVSDSEPPPVPPRSDSVGNLVDVIVSEQDDAVCSIDKEVHKSPTDIVPKTDITVNTISMEDPPIRPPRRSSQPERCIKNVNLDNEEELQTSEFEHINDVEQLTNASSYANNITPSSNSCLGETGNIELPSIQQNTSEVPIIEQVSHQSLPNVISTQISQVLSEPPQHEEYIPSQPPPSFYNLTASLPESFERSNIPISQCHICRCQHTLSRSSSLDELTPKPRRQRRLSETSIPELTGRLVQSCAVELDRSLRNIVTFFADNVLRSTDSKQDLQVLLLMLIILIASLILMSSDGKVQHHHHWEFFNPPKNFDS